MKTKLAAIALTLSAPFAFAACGSDAEHAHGDAGMHDDTSASVGVSADFNQSDVDFATTMIPHHAQAVTMVDMASGHELSAPLRAIADDIRQAQAPEIETMSGWLKQWGQPVPDTTAGDHGSHDMGDMGDMADMPGMAGMMSEDQMAELQASQGADFEQLWISMMIQHHEGAVEMAQTEIADGKNAAAIALAKAIIKAQTAEIQKLTDLLVTS